MHDKITPTHSEFQYALQSLKGHDGQKQLAAMEKVFRYAAYAAGYAADEIQLPAPKPKKIDTHIPGEGWRLPGRPTRLQGE